MSIASCPDLQLSQQVRSVIIESAEVKVVCANHLHRGQTLADLAAPLPAGLQDAMGGDLESLKTQLFQATRRDEGPTRILLEWVSTTGSESFAPAREVLVFEGPEAMNAEASSERKEEVKESRSFIRLPPPNPVPLSNQFEDYSSSQYYASLGNGLSTTEVEIGRSLGICWRWNNWRTDIDRKTSKGGEKASWSFLHSQF